VSRLNGTLIAEEYSCKVAVVLEAIPKMTERNQRFVSGNWASKLHTRELNYSKENLS